MREGRSLTLVGGGRVLVDVAELHASAHRLRAAADALDRADLRLGSAAWRAGDLVPSVPEARGLHAVLDALRHAPHGPTALAAGLRDLASRTLGAAAAYDLAETDAQARVRDVVGELGVLAGLTPLGPAALLGAASAVGLGRLLLAEARDLVTGPWRGLGPGALRQDARRLAETPAQIVADGRAALTLQLLGAALASLTGARTSDPDPVRRFAARVAGVLPAREVRLVPRAQPPDLPVPRDLAGLVDLVGRTYDDGTPTGAPGTPLATVTVQRLDHADGTRAWVVAVPGTRAAGLTGDVPTDNGTNLDLVAGVPDVMSSAVLDAMRAAGVGADEPVALVGHSQGGMVATSVAAAAGAAYAVRLVVTVGSPDVPAAVPPGVATVTLRHRQDAVSLLDGAVGERGGPAALSVVRDLPTTGGPAHPTFVEAHAVPGYVATAAQVDAALVDLPADDPVRRALADVLGEGDVPGVTRQYVVEVGAPPPPPPEPPVVRPAVHAPLDGSLPAPAPRPAPTPVAVSPATSATTARS